MLEKIQECLLLKKLVFKIFNKVTINNSSLRVESFHFKNNQLQIEGMENSFQCEKQSFLRNGYIYIKGMENKVSIDINTEIYGDNVQVIFVYGNNNQIIIGKNCVIRNTTFFINGNNNVIHLEDNVSAFGAEFHIEQDNNCLNIKKGTTFHGRNGYPVHIALDEGSNITINEDCMFSNGIQIRSTDSHSIIDLTGKRINYAEDIIIGEHCWLGLGCIILKGTIIAPHTVVAAGSICTTEYHKGNCIIAGNPARVVKDNIDWDRKYL